MYCFLGFSSSMSSSVSVSVSVSVSGSENIWCSGDDIISGRESGSCSKTSSSSSSLSPSTSLGTGVLRPVISVIINKQLYHRSNLSFLGIYMYLLYIDSYFYKPSSHFWRRFCHFFSMSIILLRSWWFWLCSFLHCLHSVLLIWVETSRVYK